jgi:hypothetical protein
MTLDLILYRPEFFMIFGFFVLLWAGTGTLVSPVAEVLTITNIYINTKKNSNNLKQQQVVSGIDSLKGPTLVSTPLTFWAIAWCILCFFCVYFRPLYSVY